MLKLEDQVCSIELAKRLKELGVKQESYFYWHNVQHCVSMKVNEDGTLFEDESGSTVVDKIDYRIELGSPFAWNIDKDNCWAAFTVAELGEMLPSEIEYGASTFNLQFYKLNKIWDGQYFDPDSSYILHGLVPGFVDYYIFDTKEADARAKMLIYLIENKLMDLKDN